MNSLRKINLFFCIACLCLSLMGAQETLQAQSKASAKGTPRDKVRTIKTIRGVFVGFEVGDYIHAIIKKSNGNRESFYLGGLGMEYFLAMHKGQTITATYEVADTFLEEAGGVVTTERVIYVKGSKQNSTSWWKQFGAKSTPKQLEQKYGKLVQKATL